MTIKRKKKKDPMQIEQRVICPYCGSVARLVKARDIFGASAYKPDEYMYVCKNYGNGCDAYVNVHAGTKMPLGKLANGELRHMRILAHRKIDAVVGANIMSKTSLYRYLSTKHGMDRFHVGESGEYYCQQTIRILDEILELNRNQRTKGGVAV